MKTDNENEVKLLRETRNVYADSVMPFEQAKNIRSLSWEGEYTDSLTFLKQAEIVGGYNNFSLEAAKKLVEFYGHETKYRLARENSVAVYVKSQKKVERRFALADEVDTSKGETRFWWD